MNATQLTPATHKPALIVPPYVAERARNKTVREPDGGCWISTYSVGSHGYAQIGWNIQGERIVTLVHRVMWTVERGPIPAGMTIDHICKVRRCVNIAHLRLLPNFENARRTLGRDWPLGECVNGHPNSFLVQASGKRACSICANTIWKSAPKSRRIPREPKPPRAPKTHCRNGHEWIPENFYTRPNGRFECLPCKAAHAKTWHAEDRIAKKERQA